MFEKNKKREQSRKYKIAKVKDKRQSFKLCEKGRKNAKKFEFFH